MFGFVPASYRAFGILNYLSPVLGICLVYSINAAFGSAMFSLLPIINIELSGAENLQDVMGIMNVYQAVAFFCSAPIASKLATRILQCKSR